MEPRRVLVTGGASGIGADVVRNFCSVGDDVTILDRVRSTDPDVRSVIGDVTAFADQQRAVAEAAPQGRLTYWWPMPVSTMAGAALARVTRPR